MKNTLYKAAIESGKILKENFGGTYGIEIKDVVSNLVTEIDKRSEKKIIEIIKADYPSHNILSEEIGAIDTESDVKWIIDPIDGTVNYAHSISLCCVSIGVEKNGGIVLGIVYNPISGEMFFAEKGMGAMLNDKQISVSSENEISKSLLVTGFPYASDKNPTKQVEVFTKIVLSDIPIRRLGSAALDICWTACGKFDGFWEYNLNPWDVAGGSLILTEAGGKLSNFSGNEFNVYEKEILATNGKIHDQMLEIIQSV
jgi:myo-inositol-1(or 4)-monophosphatase